MNIFDRSVKEWIYERLVSWGLSDSLAGVLDSVIVIIYLCLFILVVNLILRWGVLHTAQWIVARTRVKWDNVLFSKKVLRRLCDIIIPVVLMMMLPLIITALNITSSWVVSAMGKVVDIYFTFACLRFVNTLLKAIYMLFEHSPAWHGKPIKGLLQTMQALLLLVGVIIAISIIIDKSPVGLLTGLGASAAVISFIFKDTLMGLVAGVQLAANNMLKVGDWIEVPSRGVDGVVESVSLTTVKVRSWNNTVQTIPPYVLISEPFGNWQAMRDSGGRRIKRSLNVDMTSVMFATDDMLKSLQEDKIASKMLEGIGLVTPEGEPLTNLDLFMRATMRYVENHPRVNHNMLVLVRQLQPTQWGLPMELYFFSSDVNWVPYETLQAEVISCIVALAPHFSLRLYQAPSSLDLRS